MPSPEDNLGFSGSQNGEHQNEGYLERVERGVQSITSGDSAREIQDRFTSMAEQSANEIKSGVRSLASASTDKLGNLAEGMHSMVAGEDTLQREDQLNRGLFCPCFLASMSSLTQSPPPCRTRQLVRHGSQTG